MWLARSTKSPPLTSLQHRFGSSVRDRPKAVLLNASRLDYDGALDWSRIEACVDLCRHPSDIVRDRDEILRLVQGVEIVLTKEMPIQASVLADFPSSVKLLQEAGVRRMQPRVVLTVVFPLV